jgi:hypothetical protein
MRPVCRDMLGRCVLWLREKENTACRLPGRMLALQCLCAGLPRGWGHPVEDPAAHDGLLQIIRRLQVVMQLKTFYQPIERRTR